jgi:L-asparaginase II
VQRRLLTEIADACAVPESRIALGLDGCNAVCTAVPLSAMARAWAGLAEGASEADRRVRDAMLAHPELVAGTARLCTDLMRVAEGRVIAKVGAEGVYCAALVQEGVGVALKVRDGSMQHAGVALLAVLRELDDAHGLGLRDVLEHPDVRRHGPGTIRNTRGEPTGDQRLTDVPRPFAPGLRAADPAAAGGGH